MELPNSTHPEKIVADLKEISKTKPRVFLAHLRKFGTKGLLSAVFLFLLIVGGAAAFFLSQTNLDLRQQASGTPGLYKDCSGFAKEGETYCGSTAPGTCLRCVNGKGEQAGDNECKGKPCDPGSVNNTPTCDGKPVGAHSCNSLTDCCVCKQFSPGPGRSPQADWECGQPAAKCAGLACGSNKQPTPTPKKAKPTPTPRLSVAPTVTPRLSVTPTKILTPTVTPPGAYCTRKCAFDTCDCPNWCKNTGIIQRDETCGGVRGPTPTGSVPTLTPPAPSPTGMSIEIACTKVCDVDVCVCADGCVKDYAVYDETCGGVIGGPSPTNRPAPSPSPVGLNYCNKVCVDADACECRDECVRSYALRGQTCGGVGASPTIIPTSIVGAATCGGKPIGSHSCNSTGGEWPICCECEAYSPKPGEDPNRARVVCHQPRSECNGMVCGEPAFVPTSPPQATKLQMALASIVIDGNDPTIFGRCIPFTSWCSDSHTKVTCGWTSKGTSSRNCPTSCNNLFGGIVATCN